MILNLWDIYYEDDDDDEEEDLELRILNSWESLLDHFWITVGQRLDHCWTTVGPLVKHCWSTVGHVTFEALVICMLSLLAASG
eukprot:2317803-Heterocapsa_arctica.AAC.1